MSDKKLVKKKFLSRSNPVKIINIKCTEEELEQIKANAEQYAGGNMSGWIRFASINLVPKKKHLE